MEVRDVVCDRGAGDDDGSRNTGSVLVPCYPIYDANGVANSAALPGRVLMPV
jgi:hypothetical protein